MLKSNNYRNILNNSSIALRITLIYAAVGGLWILTSDQLLTYFLNNSKTITNLQTFKVWFFIIITILFLYILIYRYISILKRSEQKLSEIARGVSTTTGLDFFHSLVQHLAHALEMDYVLIGEIGEIGEIGADKLGKVRTIAMSVFGKITENMEYDLVGTPCENVHKGKLCTYEEGIKFLFPKDEMLGDLGLESYIGTPLFDSNKNVIGLLIVMDRKPLKNKALAESMLQIFAIRASAEMERMRAEKRLNHLAFHDSLTNLPNRMLFNNRLNHALDQANRNKQLVGVLFLDLDDFKIINDTLGHAIGDVLLKGVAERISQCLRKGDTVARMGGDEFTVLLQGITSIDDAAIVASKVLSCFLQSWVLNGQEVNITASIGITVFPRDGDNVDTLLKNADMAMYSAKEGGRNDYRFYCQDMNTITIEKVVLEQEIRQALRNLDFTLYYQPKVNIDAGKIIGMEALIRWNHPEKGLLPPSQFIHFAEKTGLIIPLGKWVLQEACRQNKAWQIAGLPSMQVAVNISALQFYQADFVDSIAQVLEETGLSAQYLELEITESIAMQEVNLTLRILKELKNMGVYIAIDDFGTGYSALNYLKQFPIDTLKIDRCFIQDLKCNTNDAAITNAIIAMGKSLNLDVIAEGVETEEQLNFLKNAQCNLIQGYFFGRPMTAEDFKNFIIFGKGL